MDMSQAADGMGIPQLLNQIHTQYGLLVLMLVMIIGFGFALFWNPIWKVWSAAITSKDNEIARLAKERDTCQALLLDCLRSASPSTSEKGAHQPLGERSCRENP